MNGNRNLKSSDIENLELCGCATLESTIRETRHDKEVAIIFAVGQGLTDDVPVDQVSRFDSELMAYLRDSDSAGLKAVRETGKLDDETSAQLKSDIEGFVANHWKKTEAAKASS